MNEAQATALVERYRRAKAQRATWEAHWQGAPEAQTFRRAFRQSL